MSGNSSRFQKGNTMGVPFQKGNRLGANRGGHKGNTGDTPEKRAAQSRLSVTWPMTAKQIGAFLASWKRSPFPHELLERKAEFLGVSQETLAELIPREFWDSVVRTCENCGNPFSQKRNPGGSNLFHVCAGCAARKAHALGTRAHAAEGWGA